MYIDCILLLPLPEVLRFGSAQEWRMVLYGLLVVLVILFRPSGLMGGRELSIRGIARFIAERRRAAAAGRGGQS